MRLSETFRRLSPQDRYLAHIAKGHAEDVIATLDMEAFLSLRKTGRERSPILNALKYFNVEAYMQHHMKRALGLDLNKFRRTVLDIGTGFGYFPYICEYFGNKAVAIDIPENLLYDDVTNFLGINKIHQRIEPFQPLTGLEREFDLVTAFQVAFSRSGGPKSQVWGDKEWTFFLEDVFNNVLKEGGEIALEMNYSPVHRVWVPPGARQAMQRYQARIFGASVRIKRK